MTEGSKMMEYRVNAPITTDQFIALLEASTLAERRPVHDRDCMEGMINNSNLTVSAWFQDQLVGIARCMTDFHYACYLSDIAVSRQHQKKGIGKRLIAVSRQQLGPHCKLVLIAAPAAEAFYRHIGFSHIPRCWMMAADDDLI